MSKPSTTKLILAFAAVYLIWGSTYLAIRTCVATMPPFLMAGARFLIAGAVLYAAARLSGAPQPDRRDWARCGLVGALLIVAGNGLVVWAAKRLPSSTSALMIAMAPLWFALLAWVFRGERPSARGLAGVLVGFGGIVLLVSGGDATGAVDRGGALALLFASLSWACGSVVAKMLALPPSPVLVTGMEMIAGGVLSLGVGAALGEPARLAVGEISRSSWMSFGYLIVFGSLVGFTAYSWLIGVVSPARLSTYAYVNPVVALVLGATIGGETVGPRTLASAAVILVGVLVMATAPAARIPLRPAARRDDVGGKGFRVLSTKAV